MRQVARHVGEQHVVGHVGGNHRPIVIYQQATPVFWQSLKETFGPSCNSLRGRPAPVYPRAAETLCLFQRMAK